MEGLLSANNEISICEAKTAKILQNLIELEPPVIVRENLNLILLLAANCRSHILNHVQQYFDDEYAVKESGLTQGDSVHKDYNLESDNASTKEDVKVEVTSSEDESDNDIDMYDDSLREDVINNGKFSKVQSNDIKKSKPKDKLVRTSKYYLENPQDKVLLEGYLFEERINKGKTHHYFSKNGYNYRRKERKASGVSYFVCMANGCKATLTVKYNIQDDTLEPAIQRAPLDIDHTHVVDKVDVLIKEAKKRLRRRVEENPAVTLLLAYNDVVKDIREEIGQDVNLLQQFNLKMKSYKTLSSTLHRWRNQAFSFTN